MQRFRSCSVSAVPGRSGLRSAVRGDLVTEWGLQVFCCGWTEKLKLVQFDSEIKSVGPETFARHLNTHLFGAGLKFVLHRVRLDDEAIKIAVGLRLRCKIDEPLNCVVNWSRGCKRESLCRANTNLGRLARHRSI